MMQLRLTSLPDAYAITRLNADSDVPAWLSGPGLISLTRASDELSIICLADRVPPTVTTDRGWSVLRVDTLAGLDEPGVVMAAVAPISSAGHGVFVISTHLRDYILVRQAEMAPIAKSLTAAGYTCV